MIVAVVSTLARRSPGLGALVASLPMFLLIPRLLRGGLGFPVALASGCPLTVLLYLLTRWAGGRSGLLAG